MTQRTARMLLTDLDDRFGAIGDDARATIRRHGLRATPARIAVIAALTHADHLSAPTLAETVAAQAVHLDETTIYRTLATLQHISVIHAVVVPNHVTRYGLTDPPHHHAICINCGLVRKVQVEVVRDLATRTADRLGFLISDSGAITLHGRCPDCTPG